MDQSAAVDVTDAVSRIEAAAASIPIHVARRPGPAAAEVLARAYEKATAGTSTWYRTGKRALHQPQLERFVGELTHYLDNVTAIVELGAGKGLLGRVLQDVSAISRGDRGALPLVAIEQRECPTYDSREHDVTRLNGTSVAQGFVLDDKIPHGALVIAKHFCGNASDEAVRLILASERVALAALAPCCHPAMRWDLGCVLRARGQRPARRPSDGGALPRPPRPDRPLPPRPGRLLRPRLQALGVASGPRRKQLLPRSSGTFPGPFPEPSCRRSAPTAATGPAVRRGSSSRRRGCSSWRPPASRPPSSSTSAAGRRRHTAVLPSRARAWPEPCRRITIGARQPDPARRPAEQLPRARSRPAHPDAAPERPAPAAERGGVAHRRKGRLADGAAGGVPAGAAWARAETEAARPAQTERECVRTGAARARRARDRVGRDAHVGAGACRDHPR